MIAKQPSNKVVHDFRQVTQAYELLQSTTTKNSDNDNSVWRISAREEADYRQSCMDWLGLPAEVVEESKQCPSFRNWLDGNTDAAQHWRNFFTLHGGLAPMLPPLAGHLPNGAPPTTTPTRTERRRKRN